MIGRSDLPPPPEAPRRSTPLWKRWWFWAIVVVVIVIAAAAGLVPGEGGDEGASTPTHAIVTAPTGPTSSPSPPPPPVLVPDVVGLSKAAARNALQDQALAVSTLLKRYSNESKGTVLKQTPRSSLEVPEGTTVELIVAQPFPKVPNVSSKNLTQARRTLRNAGFKVAVRKQNSTTKRDGDIISQNPPGRTEVRPGRTVTLVVINNTCTPGYSPCIPQGSDVDCAGGTGNGPRYISGPVRVTGFDRYGLDDDNDGVGCES